MREKILLQLIAMCEKLTGVSKQTLEVIADKLALTVTEESGIKAAIDVEMPSLESFQGNLRFNEAQAVQVYQDAHPEVRPAEKTPAELLEEAALEKRKKSGMLTMDDVRKIMNEELDAKLDAKLNPITEKLTASDNAKALDIMKLSVLAKIKKEYSFNPEEIKRSDLAMRMTLLKNGKPASAEELQTAWEAEYNTITTDLGLSNLEPIGSGGDGDNDIPASALVFKAEQQRKGKLPKDV